MSGALLGTYVFSEILKSWWHRLREPTIYYYRNKDGYEIDFLISRDGKLRPLEVKKSTRIDRGPLKIFSTIKRLKLEVDSGAIINLYPQVLPIDEKYLSVPVGIL
jgi:predicted AAA+ superfamily ATPase